jgi:hypothetical protein
MINNNHYFDPAEMARNAITSLLSYLTLSDGFWISEGSNPGFGPLEGSNTGIWTPQILDPGPWIWTHLGPDPDPLFSASHPFRGSLRSTPFGTLQMTPFGPPEGSKMGQIPGFGPLRVWIWPDLGSPILGEALKHPELAYLSMLHHFN